MSLVAHEEGEERTDDFHQSKKEKLFLRVKPEVFPFLYLAKGH